MRENQIKINSYKLVSRYSQSSSVDQIRSEQEQGLKNVTRNQISLIKSSGKMDEEQRRHLRAGMDSVLNTVNTVFLATGNCKGGNMT